LEIKHGLQNGKIVHKIIYLKKENIYLSKSKDILIEDLPSFVWIPEFINIAGSLFYEREKDRKPNDIDIIVRAKEEDGKFIITLDKSLRLKIDRVLEKRVGEISGKWLTPEWLGSTFGPNWKYQTGWDLVLVPHQPQEIREMNEKEFAEEFYKDENYEEFCDFGSGRFSKFVMEHPESNSEEFREYVIVHNKADRDSGELEDIAASEILRLAKEFAREKNIQIEKYKHSREKCMECDKPPIYECIWAEGIGHAWFCKEHFKEWATTGDGKGEIISVKEVKDGIAAKKFGDNRNANIWAELKREFYKDEGIEKKLSDKQREEYDKETSIINENKEKPQAKEVHEFKAAKYTHPNGHPRCLICGDEEPIGGVCNMPNSWYQKHEFDDEEAWKKEREILRERGIIKQGMDVEKLDLEEFRTEGVDDDLKNPAVRHKELFADLRYIGNSGYPKLKEGKKWGEWKLEDVLKYYAAIVDVLRSVFYPIISPKIGEKEYKTSYWECYREARKYMKSKPPAEKGVKEWDEKRKKIIKDGQEIAKFTFKKIDEVEHIVGGVVYFSYKQDSQKDWTTPPEVWKALKRFMLKKKKLKVMHEGKEREIPIIENYFVEEQHHKGGVSPKNLLEKGDWWLAVYLGDKENKDIWERVLKKELTGFSMAGRASTPS